MTAKEMAVHMMKNKALRDEAEKAMGIKFGDMTQEQRRFIAAVFAAADDAGGLKIMMGSKYPF